MFTWASYVQRLLRERDLAACHFGRSHAALFLTRVPLESRGDGPMITIRQTNGDQVLLRLSVATQVGPVRRWVDERVVCAPDRALAEFDRLYSRFVDLPAAGPPPSDA